MLVARSKGADAVAVMSIYATGQTFTWLKSHGVTGPKDFAGRNTATAWVLHREDVAGLREGHRPGPSRTFSMSGRPRSGGA